MKAITLLCTLLLLIPGAVAAQQDGIYTIPNFTFENGREMERMKVGYVTFGKLNDAKDNALLLTPGTSSGRNWANIHIGPGKAFDTDRYFVIGVDPIGGGNSSSPLDGLGADFPRYNIRDMVRAQYELVTKGLGLNSLLAVGGPSMGSFQGLEWGVSYPGFTKGLILMVPGVRADRHVHAIIDAVTAMITLDPAYAEGRYAANPTEGIRRAGTVYFPWLYSDEFLNALTDDAYDKARWSFGEGWAKAWDANSLLYRYHASRSHDPSQPFGGDMQRALGRITAKALVMPSKTDRTLPPYLAREIYNAVDDSVYAEIPSIRGHLASGQPEGTFEYAFVAGQLKTFLASLRR